MIYKYITRRKILRICILISLTVVILSGCGQNGKQDYAMQLSVQSGIHFLQITLNQMKSRIQEANEEIKNRNMPEIETWDSSVEVTIHNAEEYHTLVGCLEEYQDYSHIWLDLEETDIVVYLEDILAYQNFTFLAIEYGGTIAVQNIENLNANPLRDIELYHPYAIEENILSQIPNLQYITIHLNSWYTGALPAKELLQNTDCASIVVIWDDEGKGEVNLDELAEWDEINAMLSEDNCYLKALYVSNEDDYNYISYEFCEEETEQVCAAFICIKDRESYGEKYFDIIEVPIEKIESVDILSWYDGRRVWLEDINFDGYRDIIFERHNDPIGPASGCIGFLWNEKEQRYEWNATVPKNYRWIDEERKRITNVYTSSLEDDYFIYEYHDGIFTEKKMEFIGSLTDYNQRIWQYYEEGELMKRLEKNFDEETKVYYITYEENGIVTEKVMEEADYNNKYVSTSDLGMEYFPEFDFYWAG